MPDPSQRQQSRTEGCPVPGRPASVFRQAPARPLGACEETAVPPPDVFTAPERAPVVAVPDLEELPPMVVLSEGVTVACTDSSPVPRGPVGTPVTLDPGALAENVYFSVVAPSTSQHRFLATLTDEQRGRLLQSDITALEVTQITKLSMTQAEVLLTAIADARTALAEAARLEASGQLDCRWGNALKIRSCPAGALLTAAVPALPDGSLVINPVVIPAGSVLSSVSQAAADEAALAQAAQLARCWWTNVEISVTCLDAGFPDPVETDLTDGPFGRRTGSALVPAGTIYSTIGQADADAQARTQALAQLSCFYLNAEVNMTCLDLDADNYEGVVLLNPGTPADASLGERGNPVRVPAAAFVSVASQADADAQATNVAVSALLCVWRNAELTTSCPTQSVDGTDVPASPLSPVATVTIPAGQFTSEHSQEDADDLAAQQAAFDLQCLYCNPEIPPRCVPPAVFDRPDFTIPIPLAWVTETWSADATPGVAAGTVCGEFARNALDVAEQLGRVTFPSSASKCRYINSEIKVACVEASGITGKFTTAEGVGIADGSTPSPVAVDPAARYLVISAGAQQVFASALSDLPVSYQIPGADLAVQAKAYADDLARQTGLALLDCYFENDARTFTCQERLGLTDAQNAKLAPTSTDNYAVEAGVFRSYTSKTEANAQRDAAGLSTLYCYFVNPPIRVRCFQGVNSSPTALPPFVGYDTVAPAVELYGDGTADGINGIDGGSVVSSLAKGHPGNAVDVAEGSFTSLVSPEEVILQALTSARASLDCYWTNPALTILCGADPDDAALGTVLYKGADVVYGTIDADATGIPARPVLVSEHQETSKISALDALRKGIINGIRGLDCFWRNVAQTATCTAAPDGTHAIGDTSYVVPARAQDSYVSQADANALALTLAQALLSCLYGNDAIAEEIPDCPSGMSVPRPGLAENTVVGQDAEAVRSTALAIAQAQGGCVDDIDGLNNMLDSMGGGTGEPGPIGPSSPCAGNCHGFYA